MKLLFVSLILNIIFISCHQEIEKINHADENKKIQILPNKTVIDSAKTMITVKNDAVNLDRISKMMPVDSFYNNYPEKITDYSTRFYKIDLEKFQSGEITQFTSSGVLDDAALFALDTVSCQNIFGHHKTEYGNYSNAYLYSIEKPIMGFYPITVIQMFGVAESPMMLVLFDKNGNYINAIEVANAYGEEGGNLSSYFVNDSTLVRQVEWKVFNEDYSDVIATKQETDTIVIHKNGKISPNE